jgi:hypothetical protein
MAAETVEAAVGAKAMAGVCKEGQEMVAFACWFYNLQGFMPIKQLTRIKQNCSDKQHAATHHPARLFATPFGPL